MTELFIDTKRFDQILRGNLKFDVRPTAVNLKIGDSISYTELNDFNLKRTGRTLIATISHLANLPPALIAKDHMAFCFQLVG